MIVKINKKTDTIWDYLIDKIGNPNGTAALMGAMYAVSTLKPNLVNTHGLASYPTMNAYTEIVNNENRPMYVFVNDGYSYGICQWNWWVSKQGLFNTARKAKKSIGSLKVQLDFLWDELHTNQNHSSLDQLMEATDRMDVCLAAAYDYMKSQNKNLQIGAVSHFANQFYDYYFMHNTLEEIEKKYENDGREETKEAVSLGEQC